ncbi:MAG: hypothetical protein ACRD2B_05460 [Terriglobia bacterium]
MPTPEPLPRSRRKYTVSARVLAANRLKLEKARAVAKSIRYRPTERRLAACHANLQKAHAGGRGGRRSAARGPGFHVLDLRRAALGAGGDFESHRAAFLEAFEAANAEQERLAGAMAALFWRRWRALEWQARQERERFYRRLDQGLDRAAAELLGRAKAQTQVGLEALLIFGGRGELEAPLSKLSRRFKQLGMRF